MMKELLRTNDIVLISAVEDLLAQAGIECLVLDNHMSVLEGSLGMIARRVMVLDDDLDRARTVLRTAELGHELKAP